MLSAKTLAQKPGDTVMPVAASGHSGVGDAGAAFAVPSWITSSATADQRPARPAPLGKFMEKAIANSPHVLAIQRNARSFPPSNSTRQSESLVRWYQSKAASGSAAAP